MKNILIIFILLIFQSCDFKKCTSNSSLETNYTNAILDFIDTVQKRDYLKLDTLYFINRKNGQEDDFPNLVLPKKISDVTIVLLQQEETKNHTYTNTKPLINLMGWIDHQKREFVFVTFFPEFQHQYDCHNNYGNEANFKKEIFFTSK